MTAHSARGTAARPVRAKAVLLDPGPGKRRLGPEALRTALVDLHDFWLVLARGGDRADRPGGAGRGRRAGPARAGPVLRPRPGAAARRPQGRRPAGRAAVVPAVGRRDRARPLGAHARAGRPGRGDRPARRARAAGGPAHRRRPGAVGQGRVAVAAGLAGRHPRPLRRAGRRRPGALAQGRRRRAPGRARPEERARRAARHPADRRAGRGPAASTARRATCSTAAASSWTCRTELHRHGRPRPGRAARAGRRRGGRRAGHRRPVRAGPGAVRGGAVGGVRRRGGAAPARNALPRRGLAALRRPPVRRPLDIGVVEHAGRGRAGPGRAPPPGTRRWCCGWPPPRPAPGCRWPPAPCTGSPTPPPSCASRGRGRRWPSCCRCWAPAVRWSTWWRRWTAPGCGAGCSRSGARCATSRRGTARTSGPSTGTWWRPARRRPG